jgi:hypothetical protein
LLRRSKEGKGNGKFAEVLCMQSGQARDAVQEGASTAFRETHATCTGWKPNRYRSTRSCKQTDTNRNRKAVRPTRSLLLKGDPAPSKLGFVSPPSRTVTRRTEPHAQCRRSRSPHTSPLSSTFVTFSTVHSQDCRKIPEFSFSRLLHVLRVSSHDLKQRIVMRV